MKHFPPVTVRTTGQGPDLALIHGWGLNGEIWSPLLDKLSGHFRVHVVDLPGYGQSVGTLPANAAAWHHAGEIGDAIMAALPEQVTLCGWSLGGHIAVGALARHTRQVSRLVFCGATPCFLKKEDWAFGIDPKLLGTFQTMLKMTPKTVISRFSVMINQNDHAMREVNRLSTAVAEAGMPNTDALAGGLQILRDLDWRPLLPKINHPVLVIHGDQDPLMPVEGARAMTAQLKNARLEIFSGSAHTPFLSQPDRFLSSLQAFVSA